MGAQQDRLPSLPLKKETPHTDYSTHLMSELSVDSPAKFLLSHELLKGVCKHHVISNSSVGRLSG